RGGRGETSRPSVATAAVAAVQPLTPAGGVPVAALLLTAPPVGPAHDVRQPRADLLVASWTTVGALGVGTGEGAHPPFTVRPLLDPVHPLGEAGDGPGRGRGHTTPPSAARPFEGVFATDSAWAHVLRPC